MFSDEVKGILNYLRLQVETFKRLQDSVPSEFNQGVMAGLEMGKTWIEMTCKQEAR